MTTDDLLRAVTLIQRQAPGKPVYMARDAEGNQIHEIDMLAFWDEQASAVVIWPQHDHVRGIG